MYCIIGGISIKAEEGKTPVLRLHDAKLTTLVGSGVVESLDKDADSVTLLRLSSGVFRTGQLLCGHAVVELWSNALKNERDLRDRIWDSHKTNHLPLLIRSQGRESIAPYPYGPSRAA